MKRLPLYILLFSFFSAKSLLAQDTLPKFSLINAGNNRVIIGWVHKFENVKQISIQRSFDSLNGYKSILTVADPASPQNGYLDAKAPNDHMFYRLFIMFDKGIFLFSEAKKPVKDTLNIGRTITSDGRPVIEMNGFSKTDSASRLNPVVLKNKPNGFVPSIYVHTCRDGYVCIRLPDNEKPKKYSIKFFDNDTQLFELKEIKEREFKIDKAVFYHAGWFRFELYEDGELLENHKFYLEKDF